MRRAPSTSPRRLRRTCHLNSPLSFSLPLSPSLPPSVLQINTEKKEKTFTQRGSMYRGAMSGAAAAASAADAPASGGAAAAPSRVSAPSWASKSAAAAAPAAAAAAPAAAAAAPAAKVVTDGSKFDIEVRDAPSLRLRLLRLRPLRVSHCWLLRCVLHPMRAPCSPSLASNPCRRSRPLAPVMAPPWMPLASSGLPRRLTCATRTSRRPSAALRQSLRSCRSGSAMPLRRRPASFKTA